MTFPLTVLGTGAVTSAGLTAPQSAAAFVAGISGFTETMAPDAFGQTQIVGRVPADWRLKTTPANWLINLAARAGLEAMTNAGADPARTLLLCAPPGSERNHSCWSETNPKEFLGTLSERIGGPFAVGSKLIDGGAAALVGCLLEATQHLSGMVHHLLLIGVDSLINSEDMAALRAAGRLHGQTAQGVIPGEGAGAIVLGKGNGAMRLRTVGVAREVDNVKGTRQSQGRGMEEALTLACSEQCPESNVEFAISNFNGERYQALELLVYRARFYRTHRNYMATAYPASAFGETGSASSALSLVMAEDAFRLGYNPGSNALLEISSDDGMRAAAYLSSVDNSRPSRIDTLRPPLS